MKTPIIVYSTRNRKRRSPRQQMWIALLTALALFWASIVLITYGCTQIWP